MTTTMIKPDDDNNDDRDNFWVELGEDESFEIDDFAEADVCQVSEEFSKNENLLKLWRETSFGQVLNFVRSGESRTTKWRHLTLKWSRLSQKKPISKRLKKPYWKL